MGNVVQNDWKINAAALDKAGVMSWREIARVLGVAKSSVSDFLRKPQEVVTPALPADPRQ